VSRSRKRPAADGVIVRPRARSLLLGGLITLALGAGVLVYAIEQVGVMPRTLAPYIERRASGHNPTIVQTGSLLSRTLLTLDRGPSHGAVAGLPSSLGVRPEPAGVIGAPGLTVTTPDELRAALARVEPGTTVTLLPGTYRVRGRALDANRPGRADAPIVVRAVQPGSVVLELDLTEGFRVSAPHWRFENLDIRGVCRDDQWCEHAFHVVGEGSYFTAINNRISDFNAHFKINGRRGHFPDHGLIASNTLFNTRVRRTSNPVSPIDLVAASGWTIRANVITDFVKDGGDRVSYGGFAKGAGSDNVFERNLVWCEQRLAGAPGQRVGLSLGGGGTGASVCRDGKCIVEQERGTLRANLIAGCSDVGIYINGAAASQVADNTVVDTAGIDVRFPNSSAQLEGNLVDGPIRSRDGALLHLGENRSSPLWQAFVGMHPVRNLFAAPLEGDLRWDGAAPRRVGKPAPGLGLCGTPRTTSAAYGAFDDFNDCLGSAGR